MTQLWPSRMARTTRLLIPVVVLTVPWMGARTDLTIATTADLTLDGGADPFVAVAGAVLVGDTIVIADGKTGQIHIYLTSGELLKVVGGPGQGPSTLYWFCRIKRGQDHSGFRDPSAC